jgi:cytoskeletal protein CcmA (bactofilin family)
MTDTTSTSTQDARIAGAGTISGGQYQDVTIAGAGAIPGDIECRKLKISGTADCRGNVKAERVEVSGAATFGGDLEAAELSAGGTVEVRGNLRGGHTKASGALTVAGSVSVEHLELAGAVTVRGDAQAERFDGRGAFRIDGLLNASQIDVSLWGRSEVREIGGERISIRQGRGWSPFTEKHLYAETIEGDDVRLEDVSAKVVRGGHVEIGPGCRIDLVEFTGDFKQGNGANVGTARKVEAQA